MAPLKYVRQKHEMLHKPGTLGMEQLSRLQLEENGTTEVFSTSHHAYRVHARFIRINMANMTLMNILRLLTANKINTPHCGVLGCNTLKYCRLLLMHWKNMAVSIFRVKLNVLRICSCYIDKWQEKVGGS
jgi:hypothetical protein